MSSGFQKTSFPSATAAVSQPAHASPSLTVVSAVQPANASASYGSAPPISTTGKYREEAANRRTPRRAYRRTAGMLVGGKYAVFEGRSLSEGGIGVTIGDDPESQAVIAEIQKGVKVLVSLILPSGAPLILRGEIVHHGEEKAVGHSVGVKFDTFALHHRREIRYYVSSKEAGESDHS